MRFSFWPHASQSWQDLSTLARHAEKTGWDGLWIADHFMPNQEDNSGPCHEAWSLISALAASVPRLRIGTLVLGNTYRHPAILAKMAATVDHISGGRLVLGLGAGWQENEHLAYGIEYSTVGGRLRRLDEACQVIKSLLQQERSDFDGRFYQLQNAPLSPKPLQSPLPLLIGGGGEKVTLRIAARYADEWNVWGDVAVLKHKMAILDQHCADLGRDPADIARSAAVLLFFDDDTSGLIDPGVPARYARISGNSERLREIVAAYRDAGVDELIFPDFNLIPGTAKTDYMDRFIEEVAPVVR
jgi:F420-dependent oxidoreductase-like protein